MKFCKILCCVLSKKSFRKKGFSIRSKYSKIKISEMINCCLAAVNGSPLWGDSAQRAQRLPLGWCSAQRIQILMIAGGNHSAIH